MGVHLSLPLMASSLLRWPGLRPITLDSSSCGPQNDGGRGGPQNDGGGARLRMTTRGGTRLNDNRGGRLLHFSLSLNNYGFWALAAPAGAVAPDHKISSCPRGGLCDPYQLPDVLGFIQVFDDGGALIHRFLG